MIAGTRIARVRRSNSNWRASNREKSLEEADCGLASRSSTESVGIITLYKE